jgi:hypothetical protein
MPVTVGGVVSTVKDSEPEVFGSPPPSTKDAESTVIVAVPLNPAAGVYVAVYTVGETATKLLIEPLVVEISVISKSVDALLSVNVRVVPELVEVVGLVMVTPG